MTIGNLVGYIMEVIMYFFHFTLYKIKIEIKCKTKREALSPFRPELLPSENVS